MTLLPLCHHLIHLGARNNNVTSTNHPINASVGSHKHFKGPIDCLIVLYKTQGIRGPYKGLSAMFYR